jgi:hypothetical protein
VDEMNVVMPRKLIKDGIKPVSTDQNVAGGIYSLVVRVERQMASIDAPNLFSC